MSTIIDIMLAVRERKVIFYHKDTYQFDCLPLSGAEMKKISPDGKLPYKDTNNIRFLSYEEINHKEIMRFYVKEFVEDKMIRKQLLDILRRKEYVDAWLERLCELDLYDDFIDACGDIYFQLFEEWAEKNGLDFTKK